MTSFKRMLDFTGKVVVVSGGLGLIGKQVSFAFHEFNATLVTADVDEERFAELFSGFDNVHFECLDISRASDIEFGVKRILKKWGKIDVWVNCAYPKTDDWGNFIDDVALESWDTNIKTHLGGYFWTSKIVLESMKSNGSGCLINFGSTYGVVAPNFEIYAGTNMTTPVAYSAIKGGIITLSKYLAALYGRYNIRVNCICPGGVYNSQNERFVKSYHELTPLKRMAKDYEIAMPVVFLASDAASYITGHTLMVDGGWTIW